MQEHRAMTMDSDHTRLSRRALFTAGGATIAGTALAAVPLLEALAKSLQVLVGMA
jgi:hypothetical protein